MKETVLTVEDAARCLPDLVERIRTQGEAALLTASACPVARIPDQQTEELISFLRRWRMAHPEPDEQFGSSIEAS